MTVAAGVSDVSAFHGGRRIEVIEHSPYTTRQFAYDPATRTWTAAGELVDTLRSGTWLSMSRWSHGRDSLLLAWASHDQSGPIIGVEVWDTAAPAPTPVTVIPFPLPTAGSDTTCVEYDPGYWNRFWVGGSPEEGGHWDSTFVSQPVCLLAEQTGTTYQHVSGGAFPPTSEEALVTGTVIVREFVSAGIWERCPLASPSDAGDPQCRSVTFEWRSEGTTVWPVNLRTSDTGVPWTRSGRIFWLGLVESGGEVVLGEGMTRELEVFRVTSTGWVREYQPATFTGCTVSYRNAGTGGATAAAIPTDDACRGDPGEGTIAPAPPVVGLGATR